MGKTKDTEDPVAYVDGHASEYLAFLSDYLSFDSTNPALGENADPYACHRWLRDTLLSYGIFDTVDYWESGEGFSNVVAVMKGTGGEPLMFAGHTDTVPVTDMQKKDWRPGAGPWSGAVADGCVWGRGASDMKAGGAAPLMAAKALSDMGIRPSRTLIFTYVMSEENGGRQYGIDSIVERGYSARECIVMEPSNSLAIVPAIQGEFYFTIDVKGRSYHIASRHHTIYPHGYSVGTVPGRNAIDLAVDIIGELRQLERQLGLYVFHPLTENGSTTINISGIESKGIFSAGAEECRITGSMLYCPSLSQDSAFSLFRAAVQRAADRDLWMREHPPVVTIPYLLSAKPPVDLPVDHPLCRQLEAGAKRVGLVPKFEACLSTSDANYLADHGIDTITMGPGRNEYGVHGTSEFVPVKEYLDAVKIYAAVLSNGE